MVTKSLLAICVLAALLSNVAAAPTKLSTKINPALRKILESKTRVNILVSMSETTHGVLDTLTRNTYATRGDRATAVYKSLLALATKSQANVLQMINSPKFFTISVQSFWISNQIYIQGADQVLIESLAALEEVGQIDEEEIVYLDDPVIADPEDPEEPSPRAEWGIDKIRAQQAWSLGNGNGAVVGIIDTGARHTHSAIKSNYRGGTHSWYNPYGKTQNPGDGHGHGTHCTGTVAGSQGIGVAPGAKWISCKGLNDQGSGTNAALIACGQFMACPHTYNGGSPNCDLAPHAVSNSWGGGSGASFYDAVIRSWHAANIIPVFANGNSGSSCRSSNSPADSQAGVIAVGATTSSDAIASFSSRGPSNFNTQKPDISAPGNSVRSAGHRSDTAYATMSGTSMACPHVAGLVGLLKARNPDANYATIKNILESTADRNLSFGSQTCSGVSERQFPNYTFGYGRINAEAAMKSYFKSLEK